jgi:hypothetical protein
MEAGIRHGGGRSGLGGFYSARATWRCGGGEVVWWSAAVGASMYRLQEWRGARRRGNKRVGHCQKGKRGEAVTLHDVVVRGRPVGSCS